MKKCFFLLSFLSIVVIGFSQTDPNQPPYLRFPTYPPVKLLMTDSSRYFTKDDLNKKGPIMLIVYNPQCDHCQHETEEIIKHIDELKKVQIVMATVMPFDSMMAYRKKYKLARYSNIIMGQDQRYFLPTFYKIRSLPFMAFYNRKQELISVFEGNLSISKALDELKK